MERPVDYIAPDLLHRIIDPLTSPKLELPTGEVMPIPEYYNRGRYRVVYLLDHEVIKVFKYCSTSGPFSHYFGRFYDDAMDKVKEELKGEHLDLTPLERMTYLSSLAITRLEEETYLKSKEFKPERILETKYGIIKKRRIWGPYYRPYSLQPFLTGAPLNTRVTGKREIRKEPIDDSLYSLYGCVLDFDGLNKTEVLEGIEDFIELFEKFYNEEDAVLELWPNNIMVPESSCFDLQKYHKNDWMWWDDESSPRDIFHLLKGMLEVNQ